MNELTTEITKIAHLTKFSKNSPSSIGGEVIAIASLAIGAIMIVYTLSIFLMFILEFFVFKE